MDTTVVFIVIKSHILFNSKIFTNCIFCCSKSQPLTPKGSLNAAQQMVLGYTLTLPALCQSFYTTLLIISLRTANPSSLILTLAVSASRQLCSGVCAHTGF